MIKAEEEEEEEEEEDKLLTLFWSNNAFCFHDTMQLIAFWEIDLTPSGMGILEILARYPPQRPKPYMVVL